MYIKWGQSTPSFVTVSNDVTLYNIRSNKLLRMFSYCIIIIDVKKST